jgi:hypothetical protein
MGMRAANFLLVLALAPGAMINVAMAQSGAHGNGHAQHHDMYKDWQRPDVGGPCCNAVSSDDPNGDCRPTTAYMGATAGGGCVSSQAQAASSSCRLIGSSIGRRTAAATSASNLERCSASNPVIRRAETKARHRLSPSPSVAVINGERSNKRQLQTRWG